MSLFLDHFGLSLCSVCVCLSLCVCACERLMKRGKGTHAKMTRACIRAADVSKQPPTIHPNTFSFPFSDAKFFLILSNLHLCFSFFCCHLVLYFLPPSIHLPSSILHDSSLHPILYCPPPTCTLLLLFPSILPLPPSLCSPPLQMSWSYLPDSLAPFFTFCLLLSWALRARLTS